MKELNIFRRPFSFYIVSGTIVFPPKKSYNKTGIGFLLCAINNHDIRY